MARYTKTWPDDVFMGWDVNHAEAGCTEATLKEDLGQRMAPYMLDVFDSLEPGQKHTSRDNITYFREW